MRAIVAGLVTVCLALLGTIGVVKVAPRALVFGAIDEALARAHVAGVRVADLERTSRSEADGVERVAWRAVLEGTVQTLAARNHAEGIVSGVGDVLEVDADRVAVSQPGAVGQPDALSPPDPTMAKVVFHLSWEAGRVSASGKLPSEVATDIPLKLATQFPGAVLTTDLRPLPGPAAPALRGVIDSAVRALSVARRGKVEIRDGTFVLDAVYGAPEMEGSVRTLVTEKVGVVLRTTLVTRVELGVAAASDAADAAQGLAAAESVPVPDMAAAEPTAAADAVSAEPGEVVAEVVVSEGVVDAVPAMEVGAIVDGGPIAPADAADAGMTDPGGNLTPAQCKALIDQLIAAEKRITFKGAKELTPDADAKVQQIAAFLARCPDAKTTVSGYHDDYGEPDHINAITGMRANAVFKRLIELGIDKARLKWRGRGYANMRYSTRTQGSRVLNQRIEFDIVLGAP